MTKDEIFFAEGGLTTTSANHIANLAKEQYRLEEQNLQYMKFYSTRLELIDKETSKLIEQGQDSVYLNLIKERLVGIANLKSLIAWLREAIKAKDRLIEAAKNLDDQVIASFLGIEIPTTPVRDRIPTEDDVISTFNIKKRNRIYYLQTLCAVLGETVHQDGSLAEARKELEKVISQPVVVRESGRDTLIYNRIPTVSLNEVDTVYFDIQATQRQFQAELNSLKHEIEVAIQNATREADAKFSKELSEYRNRMNEIQAKIVEYRNQKVAEAQALKIIIPDSLKSIYEKVSKLGK